MKACQIPERVYLDGEVEKCGGGETNVASMKAARRRTRRTSVRQSRDNVRWLGRDRTWGAVGSDQTALIFYYKKKK